MVAEVVEAMGAEDENDVGLAELAGSEDEGGGDCLEDGVEDSD